MMDILIFDGWATLVHIFLTSLLIYPFLVFLLRIFGKRSLSQVNMFDFVITVAYGSTLGSIILTDTLTIIEGALGLFMLIGMQSGVALIQARSVKFAKLLKSEPVLLYYQGEPNEKYLDQTQFRMEDLKKAVRTHGLISMEPVEAIVLEGDGSISVVPKSSAESHDALSNVIGMENE